MAKESCHNCIYAWRDMCQVMAQFALGFPYRPTCANQPGHYGLPTPTPFGRVCRNYRPKPPNPGAEAKPIILTNGMVAYVDAADYEELSRYTWHFASGGYAARHENGAVIFMHRQIMNPPKGMVVDHIRSNRLDNTRAHLRICTRAENARNRAKNAGTTSRYFGVSYWSKRKKWVAAIYLEGHRKHLGYFDVEEEAARAYDYAAVLYLDDFARLNFPEEWPPQRRAEVRATRPAESVERKAKKPTRKPHNAKRGTKSPRATGHGPRATKKKSRAETPGRRGRKQEPKSGQTPRRAPGDQRRATKKKAKRGPPKT